MMQYSYCIFTACVGDSLASKPASQQQSAYRVDGRMFLCSFVADIDGLGFRFRFALPNGSGHENQPANPSRSCAEAGSRRKLGV